jgi:hypothetical protein
MIRSVKAKDGLEDTKEIPEMHLTATEVEEE